jgi:Xaa-Pro aminopeptidase
MLARAIIPGVALSVEPGIYLPELGARSEIDVFMSADGPRVTTLVQRDVALIGA